MNTKFRALAFIGIGRALEKTMQSHLMAEKDGVAPSCLSCVSFDEPNEACAAASGQRPPARIIAFGCNLYRDKDDIPF